MDLSEIIIKTKFALALCRQRNRISLDYDFELAEERNPHSMRNDLGFVEGRMGRRSPSVGDYQGNT